MTYLSLNPQSEDGALKLVAHPTGLFTVSVCVMSNYSKSRVLSLQLLARLCDDAKVNGHRQVCRATLNKTHIYIYIYTTILPREIEKIK